MLARRTLFAGALRDPNLDHVERHREERADGAARGAKEASASSVSTLRSLKLCGELMMYDLRPSKTASWIAPKGTSRHSEALHARSAFAPFRRAKHTLHGDARRRVHAT